MQVREALNMCAVYMYRPKDIADNACVASSATPWTYTYNCMFSIHTLHTRFSAGFQRVDGRHELATSNTNGAMHSAYTYLQYTVISIISFRIVDICSIPTTGTLHCFLTKMTTHAAVPNMNLQVVISTYTNANPTG